MFRCSDTTVVTFVTSFLKIENYFFSIDSIFALLVFSFQGASPILTNQDSEGLILQNRTMNIFFTTLALKKPFVMLRITHAFALQTYLKPLCQPVLQAIHSDKSFHLAFLRFSP